MEVVIFVFALALRVEADDRLAFFREQYRLALLPLLRQGDGLEVLIVSRVLLQSSLLRADDSGLRLDGGTWILPALHIVLTCHEDRSIDPRRHRVVAADEEGLVHSFLQSAVPHLVEPFEV